MKRKQHRFRPAIAAEVIEDKDAVGPDAGQSWSSMHSIAVLLWRLYMATMPFTSGCLYLLLGKGLSRLCWVGLGLDLGVLPATVVVFVAAFALICMSFHYMAKHAATDDDIPPLPVIEGKL